jgi:hypothetical protein
MWPFLCVNQGFEAQWKTGLSISLTLVILQFRGMDREKEYPLYIVTDTPYTADLRAYKVYTLCHNVRAYSEFA